MNLRVLSALLLTAVAVALSACDGSNGGGGGGGDGGSTPAPTVCPGQICCTSNPVCTPTTGTCRSTCQEREHECAKACTHP
jgi:hypothetical protein